MSSLERGKYGGGILIVSICVAALSSRRLDVAGTSGEPAWPLPR